MSKLKVLLALGWCVAGLLALQMVLRAETATATVRNGPVPSVVETIRTRCELPANTLVFVVRQ
jgi:hypothetical protein